MPQITTANQTKLQGFVSIQGIALNQSAFDSLIRRCLPGDTWCCVRSPQTITFKAGLPTDAFLSSPEGQVFGQVRELRWKHQNDVYKVLLLSKTEIDDQALQPLDQEQQWLIRDLNAKFYPPTETRFPRGVSYPEDLEIGQRYFMDSKTGIVQFVALRGEKRGK